MHMALDAVMDSRSGIASNTVKMAAQSAEHAKQDALKAGKSKRSGASGV
jgi:hypothetical protein